MGWVVPTPLTAEVVECKKVKVLVGGEGARELVEVGWRRVRVEVEQLMGELRVSDLMGDEQGAKTC